MAVLAAHDWQIPREHIPREHSMDSRPSPVPATVNSNPYPYPVQQLQHQHQQLQQQQQQQQAGQQQQGQPLGSQGQQAPLPQQPQPQGPPPPGWQPPPAAFFPAYYQNHPGSGPAAFGMHAGQHPQPAFFDPNAAQFAQWYHQMMFSQAAVAQAHHQQQQQPRQQQQQSSAPGPPSSRAEYFQQSPFNAFPSGTPPPPHPQHQAAYHRASPQPTSPSGTSPAGVSGPSYDGFHPYRRPARQGTQHAEPPPPDWRGGAPGFQPPYARGSEAAGSSSSVNSTGSAHRARTSSLQGQQPQPGTPPGSGRSRANGERAPTSGSSSRTSSASGAGSPPGPPRPHARTASSSSSGSQRPSPTTRPVQSSASTISTGSVGTGPRTPRPSPLGQGSMTLSAAEKRKSRDDSELLALSTPAAGDTPKPSGIKGRLRRALSLSAAQAVEGSAGGSASGPETGGADGASTAGKKKKSRTALFNARLNASTDNISLSSTMSSASVVIRKLGSIGKLARRNSLAGITAIFKDKDKDKEREDAAGEDAAAGSAGDRKGKKKGKKGAVVEPSVSQVSMEVDRAGSSEFSGLSPAAELARRHTLKTNAQEAAAAKAKAEAEAAAAAAAAAAASAANGPVPETWEKNTATRAGLVASGAYRVDEDGHRVLVEEDEEDEDWSRLEGEDDEDDDEGDMTIRQALEGSHLEDDDDESVEAEPWAIGVRRSVERTRQPARGILKNADNYDQHIYMDPAIVGGFVGAGVGAPRARSNSYNSSATAHETAPGPLAHITSPDPDHIDGLHRHNSMHGPPSLPPLSFDTSDSPAASDDEAPRSVNTNAGAEKVFSHPALNSSAPVLSTLGGPPPPLAHRAQTTPVKRLAFATNLSVYDTFPSQVYDRRSEPATWSRLTPALAQRIKEELNSYKMEEMEVHAASRIHTQFFV
ncbi:hypothetical protein K488DRAFT_80476 [Vararia minispora EC-137]|uniref:Uncharacterized protein n=1 Tax=Vararia minispora EC-137 TaxID=1314806 RepID=A0ACB8QB35_9AGAM|nr:hypothetical protein K488DRAFT_80476 [Vararia minispora EC-137]